MRIKAYSTAAMPFAMGIAATTAVAVSAACNALFGYRWGGLLMYRGIAIDGALLAAAAIAGDIIKAGCLPAMMRARSWGHTIAPALGLILCISVSATAAVGFIAELRAARTGGLAGQQGAYDRATAAYKAAGEELARLGPGRTAAEIEAAIAAAPVSPAMRRRTADCTDITKRSSQEGCKPLLALRAEMAAAKRRAQAEARRAEARRILDGTPRPADTEPQATAIATAFGLDRAWVAGAIPLLLAAFVEALSVIGFALVKSLGAAPSAPPPPTPASVHADAPQDERALDWVLTQIAIHGGAPDLDNQAIARRFGVSESTATRWRQQWERDGLIRCERAGKRMLIRSA